MTFNNRTAVITGAAGRIGQGTARKFAKYGVKLFLADINMERLNTFAAELKDNGADVHPILMDVADSGSIITASNTILQECGRVDILVNNAGAWPKGQTLECSDSDWQNILNINLNSIFYLSKFFGQKMKEQHYGRIINLGSIAGIVGLPGRCAYSVAKAGVIMLTKVMAMELGQCGVTVNSVSPGLISDVPAPSNGTWLGRSGTGDEVANAIVFLASDDSGYITGVDFPVDGGRILGPHKG